MAGSAIKRVNSSPAPGTHFVISHTMTDGAATTDYSEAVAFPFPVAVVASYVSVTTTLAAAGTNYNTISISDGTNNILYGDSNSAGDNAAFTADTPRALSHFDGTHAVIAAGSAIYFKKTHAGTPANTMGQVEFILQVVVVG